MIETFKEFTFEAARSLPPHHSLERHVFKVCLHLRGDPDPVYGWPVSTAEVDRLAEPLLKKLQHRHLNEVEGLALPSSENIARWIWDRLSDPLPALARVAVSRGRDGAREGCVYTGRG
jgi:6-pyruvoyltetrahydropterin/6-carboxytetrahydropterin synthase